MRNFQIHILAVAFMISCGVTMQADLINHESDQLNADSPQSVYEQDKSCKKDCTQERLCEIISKLNNFGLCAAIPITSPTIISTPGHYCLAKDLTAHSSIITIEGVAASNILLDLNGHNLKSVGNFATIVTDNKFTHTNITIQNGALIGGKQGISVANSNDIHIKNLSIYGMNESGIQAQKVEKLVIEDCMIFNNIQRNIAILDSKDIRLLAILAADSLNGNSITILASQNILVKDCSSNNSMQGFTIDGCTCIELNNCQAHENGIGFINIRSSNILFDSCYACNNETYGFLNSSGESDIPSNICIVNSVAKENGLVGFVFGAGSGVIKENQAVGNGVCGFSDFLMDETNFTYISNLAKNNGENPANIFGGDTDSNYCVTNVPTFFTGDGPGPIPFGQVKLAKPPTSFWQNITEA